MIAISKAFYDAAKQPNIKPIVMFTIINAWGMFAYCDQEPDDNMIALAGDSYIADGSYLADGSVIASSGGQVMLGWGARAMSFGEFTETLDVDGLAGGLSKDQVATMTVVMDNRDMVFSKMVAGQNLIGATGLVQIGYKGLSAFTDYMTRFRGKVIRLNLNSKQCQLFLRASTSA
uniref:Uncharacterized protein n=1 Tax=viral metagenome TaxID=1070528 RepID=A0A6H1ZTQ9_9ZZZZ